MSLQKISLPTTAAKAEILADLLLEVGAVAVSFEDSADQPIFEPDPGSMPLWATVTVSSLMPAECDWQNRLQQLAPDWQQYLTGALEQATLVDQDWVAATRAQFKPLIIGDLCICPSWEQAPPNKKIVMLDPGLAFGTGSHPTTALCLAWLQKTLRAGMAIIDYGCGSGILAIAATLFGAREIYAIDLDPQALTATRQNAEQNACDLANWHLLLPEAFPVHLQADWLIANILANPLKNLAETFAAHLKPGAPLGLSGILREQVDDVAAAYHAHFYLEEPVFQDEWALLAGHKR